MLTYLMNAYEASALLRCIHRETTGADLAPRFVIRPTLVARSSTSD